jgi:secondary thiamine-phosphate synthase enzyme
MSISPVGFTAQVFQDELRVRTEETCGFHDITDEVSDFVERCGLEAGMVLLLSFHTTAGLLLNEHETGFRRDFKEVAQRIAPVGQPYCHDDLSVRFENLCPEDREFPNGHAHLQHAVFGSPSLVVPVGPQGLVLGKWQRIFLIEFDRARDRRVGMFGLGAAGSLVGERESPSVAEELEEEAAGIVAA